MGDEVDLHGAARTGDVDALGKCIAAGADVNGRDKHKRTALHSPLTPGSSRPSGF